MSLGLAGIYCIRNILSGRVYVGSAVNVGKRWRLHRSLLNRGKHHSIILQRSWTKHGSDKFSFYVVENPTVDTLIEREQHWIDLLDSSNPENGFNVAPNAGTSLGRIHPPEVREKMSLAAKGKKKPPFTDAHRAAISASRMGNQWSKGIPKSDEHRRKQSATMTGRKMPWVGESNKNRAELLTMEKIS